MWAVKRVRGLQRYIPQKSYSQTGEDLIIKHLLGSVSIKEIFYIDIGAHHPRYLSNTKLFYNSGSHGICIEPDPVLFKRIKKHRRRDECLNVGIGEKTADELDFYIMNIPALNTFSKKEAEELERKNYSKIEKVIKIPVVSINSILSKHSNIDLLTIDTEGLDFQILESIDYQKHRPMIICVETIEYQERGIADKEQDIMNLLTQNGYKLYADTHINSIFIDTHSTKLYPKES